MSQVSSRVTNETDTVTNGSMPDGKEDAFPGAKLVNGKIDSLPTRIDEAVAAAGYNVMRPPPNSLTTSWEGIQSQLVANFNYDLKDLESYHADVEHRDTLLEIYKSMQLSRLFELACNKQYMVRRVQTKKIFLSALNDEKHAFSPLLVCHLDLPCFPFNRWERSEDSCI